MNVNTDAMVVLLFLFFVVVCGSEPVLLCNICTGRVYFFRFCFCFIFVVLILLRVRDSCCLFGEEIN